MEMKEKAMKIIEENEEGINLSDLKDEYNKRYEDTFSPTVIGKLCEGEEPLCYLRGGQIRKATTIEPQPQEKEEEKAPTPPPTPTPEEPETGFYETNNEYKKILYAISKQKNTLLVGPTGCGKSFLVQELAKKERKKLRTVNCDNELDKTELVGHYEIVSDGKTSITEWVKGILTRAMEDGDWIVLDEVNMAHSEVLSVMHQALDHRRTLTIKEHREEEIKAHPDFRVFATMNPAYAGTAELNKAFRRRFEVIINVDYLNQAMERKLLIERTGISSSVAGKCVNVANDTRSLFKEGKINNPVSTAHLLEFALAIQEGFSPLDSAMMSLSVSDDEDEMQDILNCVKSYF